MPTDTIEATAEMAAPPSSEQQHEFMRTLAVQTAAVRFRLGRFGTRKALDQHQVDVAAEQFQAKPKFVSASKKLLDTKAPVYKAVTTALARARTHWKVMTVPYPDPGVRLMKRERIAAFDAQMNQLQTELREAVVALKDAMGELKTAAQTSLGDLYNAADYPTGEQIDGLFWFEWNYPSLAVPEYLKQLNPQLYEAEKARLESRLQDAVAQHEQELVAELEELVIHLIDKLQPGEDGKPKQIRDSAVENLGDFFARFSDLGMTSNPQLAALVEQAEQAVAGVDPKELRKDAGLREHVRSRIAAVKQSLETVVVERPSRAFDWSEDE